MRKTVRLALVGSLISVGCVTAFGASNWAWLESEVGSSYPYVVSHLPSSAPRAPRALVVYLHGAGHKSAAKLKVRSLQLAYYARPFLDATVIAPFCPTCEVWSTERLRQLFESSAHEFQTGERVYVVGFSMGAFAAWWLAEVMPDKVTAIVPVAGGAAVPGQRCGHVPVWAFHGLEDKVIPPETSEEMAHEFELCGEHPRVTLVPGMGHEFKVRSLATYGVFEWLEHQSPRRAV